MKILSIDTSSNICSTAILEDDKIIDEINLNNAKTHSENLMPIVSEILIRNHLKLSNIDLISCCVGPGSFTGIRIGVASMKAIAEVHNIPIASVTSLETLARIDNSDRMKVTLIDAKNNQVYCGIFDQEYKPKEDFVADNIENIIKIIKKYKNVVCIGSGAMIHKDMIMQNIFDVKFSDENEQKAIYTGKMAYTKYLLGDLKTADTIQPIYLRKSQAERMRKIEKSCQ